MDYTKLNGYLNEEITHSNPIPVLPPAKVVHNHKDTTLFEKALKSLLKERMYGNLLNFQTKNIQNKNHIGLRADSQIKNRSFLSSLDQSPNKIHINAPKSKFNHSFFDQVQKRVPTQKSKYTDMKNLSQISSTLNISLSKTRNRRFSLVSQKKVKFIDEINESLLQNYDQQSGNTHFISAVDVLEPKSSKHPQYSLKQISKRVKLPQISDTKKSINLRQQHAKISKALFKQNEPRITVRQDFWLYVCNKKDQRIRRSNQTSILRNQSSQKSIGYSIAFPTTKSIANSNYTGLETRRSLNKYNQNLVLSKEMFQNFIINEKLSLSNFITHILSFFQATNKFTDKASKTQFELIFTGLHNQSDRAWCFTIFQFLDCNGNFKIDSSDLFNTYNIIDYSKTIIEHQLQSAKISTPKQINESRRILQKSKRQKTQYQINGLSGRKSANKKGTNVSIALSTKKKIDFIDQNEQPENILIKRNFENVCMFLKQIQLLNKNLISQTSMTTSKQIYNPQSSSSPKSRNNQKVDTENLYLQEGLLDKKDTRVSQLSSIFQQISSENTSKKKKLLQIDPKKLKIKLSSAYVQTFTALNHNEETRLNRQFLEGLKDKLKQKSQLIKKQAQNNQSKGTNGITYRQFYEDKIFLPFKRLFFNVFQIIV